MEGSHGKGRWTIVPWVAVFHRQITTTAQKGVYIVYLLNKDTKTLYLTLNQGATMEAQKNGTDDGKLVFTGIARTKSARINQALSKKAEFLRTKLTPPRNAEIGVIDTGSPAYDAGCIFFKSYNLETLPQDDILISDLNEFIEVYKSYSDWYLNGKEELEAKSQPDDSTSQTMPIADVLENIKDYISSQGFTYDDLLIDNFYLSLKSKPFVILAGTSGTGKTKLVRLFAEAIGAKYKLISVRPDWSDGSDLFGYKDLNGNTVEGPLFSCIKLANENPDKPVFVCLDEMNLARVEYYLSDFLSVIESRRKTNDKRIVTDPIFQFDNGIPDNLYIIGTVNMDETTFPFSKKVLDRANTIEFNYVDLVPDFDSAAGNCEPLELDNSFLRAEYLILAKDCSQEDQEFIEEICYKLQALNDHLKKANAHVGYRVRDEIVFYMLNNRKAGGLMKDDEALDHEVLQKILPRIQGSSVLIKDMLLDLYQYCNNGITLDPDSKDLGKQMQLQASASIFPLSASKIGFMMMRYEEDGFTSYWL